MLNKGYSKFLRQSFSAAVLGCIGAACFADGYEEESTPPPPAPPSPVTAPSTVELPRIVTPVKINPSVITDAAHAINSAEEAAAQEAAKTPPKPPTFEEMAKALPKKSGISKYVSVQVRLQNQLTSVEQEMAKTLEDTNKRMVTDANGITHIDTNATTRAEKVLNMVGVTLPDFVKNSPIAVSAFSLKNNNKKIMFSFKHKF